MEGRWGGEIHGVCSVKKDVPGHPSSRYYISGPTFETGVSVRWKGGGARGGEVHGGGALGVAEAAQ